MANLKATDVSGNLKATGHIFGYNYTNNHSAPAFVFDKNGSNFTGIGSHNIEDTIWFGAVNTSNYSWNDSYKQKWKFNGSIESVDGMTVGGNFSINGTLATPGSTPLVSINYNPNSHPDLGDNGLNIVKFGNTDNYVGQSPASRSPNSLPGFAFHTSMDNISSEFAWISHNWTYRMTLNTNGLSLYHGSVNIGQHFSNDPGEYTWLTLVPYRHTGGPWYIRNVDTASDSFLQLKYGTDEVFRMKHDGLIETKASSIQFTTTGTGTYNRAAMYIDSSGLTWEAPRATNSSSGTAGHHYFKVRGGDLTDVHMRSIIFNGSIGATSGSYIVYDSNENAMFINGKGKVYLESGISSGHPMVRLAGTDYTIVHTGNVGSYCITNAGDNPKLGNGGDITQPGGEAAISIRTTTGANTDCGIFRLTQDNAYICNSGDNNYVFAVYDKDQTNNFSNADLASFVVLEDYKGVKIKGKRVVTCDSNGGNGVMTYSNGTLTIS